MTRRVATRRATTGTLVALAVAAAGLWVTAGREHGAAGCAAPAVEDLASPIEAVIGWFDRARLADDTFWYEYDRSSDEFSPSYNEVRHAGVTMSLYQAAMAGFDDALTVA
ncbi:MAG: hypothetical protein ACE5GB_06095, partial [Acidimicrobiales bacterium]